MASFSCVIRPRVTPAAVAASRAQRLHFRAQQAATRDLRVRAAGSEDSAASEPDGSEEDTLEETTQEVSYDPSAPLDENWDKDGSATEESALAPTLKLNVVWLDKRIALAVDQVFMKDGQAPVTEYYPWPTRDAWEELKEALEARAWIGEREKILILNQATQVINFWQDEEVRHTLEEARTQFPEVTFLGA